MKAKLSRIAHGIIDCEHGNVLTAGYFFDKNPQKIEGDKILRGDGGVPAVVHQYDRQASLIQLVNTIYRDKDFQPDESFNDTRSMLDQVFYLVNLNRVGDAYKLFTKHLFGRNFDTYVGKLIEIWQNVFAKNFTASSELLLMSIQGAIVSTSGNNFNFNQINQLIGLTDICIKNHIAVSYAFKIFMRDIVFVLANHLYDAKQFEQCIAYLNFITTLNVPLDANFYLLQARIYRETGRKSEALAAYERALNF